jgi:hypothetical protein
MGRAHMDPGPGAIWANTLQIGCKKAAHRLHIGCKHAANRLQTGCQQAANRLEIGCKQAANRLFSSRLFPRRPAGGVSGPPEGSICARPIRWGRFGGEILEIKSILAHRSQVEVAAPRARSPSLPPPCPPGSVRSARLSASCGLARLLPVRQDTHPPPPRARPRWGSLPAWITLDTRRKGPEPRLPVHRAGHTPAPATPQYRYSTGTGGCSGALGLRLANSDWGAAGAFADLGGPLGGPPPPQPTLPPEAQWTFFSLRLPGRSGCALGGRTGWAPALGRTRCLRVLDES